MTIEPAPEIKPPFTFRPFLLAGWALGGVSLLAAVTISTLAFSRRLKRATQPAPDAVVSLVRQCADELKLAAPRVVLTDLVATPAIFSAVRPVLLLPESIVAQLSSADLRSVVLHELEHVRRHHLKMEWVLTLIRALHWFNPAMWWAQRQIRACRELICDQAVLARLDTPSARQYGLTMLQLAAGRLATPRGVPMAAFAQQHKVLHDRIEAIAGGKGNYIAGLGIMVAVVLAMMFMTRPSVKAADEPKRDAERRLRSTNDDARNPTDAERQLELAQSRARIDYAQADLDYKTLQYERMSKGPKGVYSAHEIEAARFEMVLAQKRLDVVTTDAGIVPPHLLAAVQGAPPPPATAPRRVNEQDQKVLDQLERKLPEVHFDAVPFADVVDFLHDVSSANIFVNWKALEAAGIDRKEPISARLRDVKFSKALEIILLDAGGTKAKLGYSVDQGVITISTVADLPAAPATQPTTAPARGASPNSGLDKAQAVADLIRSARQKTSNGQYDEALRIIEEILKLDPNDEYANGSRPMLQDRAAIAGQRPVNEQDQKLLDLLERNLPEVRFDNIGLADAIDFLRDVTTPNIFVNWRAMEAAGIDRNTPVSIRLRDVKFSKALETILLDVGGAAVKLGYAVDQGVITISTVADLPAAPAARPATQPNGAAAPATNPQAANPLDRRLPELRFDGRPLAEVLDFLRDVASINIAADWRALEAAGIDRNTPVTARLRDVPVNKVLETVLRDVGGANARLGYRFDEGVVTITTAQELEKGVTHAYDVRDLVEIAPAKDRAELLKQVMSLIQDTVANDSWKVNGGKIGSIREAAGQLIIEQTTENHQQITRLLEQLRETRAIKIQIVAQLLEIPGDKAAELRKQYPHPTPAAPQVVINTSYPAGGFFIDDFQVKQLVAASTRTLNSPPVTIVNGQGAAIDIAADDKSSAIKLEVFGTVSADRKYVTITAGSTPNAPTTAPAAGTRTVRWDLPKSTSTIPDGATLALTQLRHASFEIQNNGQEKQVAIVKGATERWIVLRPTILIQREGKEAVYFPLLPK